MIRHETPDMVPVLSRGKHWSPRNGACFMEYASFLAGERWSDHPQCTHPLLAEIAREVNDHVSDDGRCRLVPLIPSVVGLNGDDPRLDVGIAARCAILALPVVAEFRQRALAVGLLGAEQVLPDLDRRSAAAFDTTGLLADARRVLARVPHAARWAEGFVADATFSAKVFQRRSSPSVVGVAVTGIAEACISNPDDLLHELLATVIDDCIRWLGGSTHGTTSGSRPRQAAGTPAV